MAALRRSYGSKLVLILQQIEKMEPRPNCDCLIDVKVLHTVLRRLTVYSIDSDRELLEKDIYKFELKLPNLHSCATKWAVLRRRQIDVDLPFTPQQWYRGLR